MSVHFTDSMVFGDSVGTPAMREIFEETSMFQSWLDVEAALAEAMAELDLIPASAAERIRKHAKVELIDLEGVKKRGKVTGHSLLGLLGEFRDVIDHEEAKYVHWGATTQDIIDTGNMLMVKKGYTVVKSMLRELMQFMLPLLTDHADTVMVGRTHGGHALPITFGYKAATWLSELSRHYERLEQATPRILVGNITGAVGTFASWGDMGRKIQEKAMAILDLGVADTCWHSSRDRTAEFMNLYAQLAGTCARISREVYTLSKTEFQELEEPFPKGQVGSSTMPHKRNPIHTEWTIVLSRVLRTNAALATEVMVQENERDATNWKTEWIIIPESHVMMSGVLQHMIKTMDGLQVKTDNMLENTNMLRGLLLSESAMFVVAKIMPLPDAHELVYQASMRAFENKSTLLDELWADDRVSAKCDRDELANALDARSYVGLAPEVAKDVHDKVARQLADIKN